MVQSNNGGEMSGFIKISNEVESSLTWLARAGIEDLYSTAALTELKKKRNQAIPKRIGKQTINRRKILAGQIPTGIYIKTNELISLIERSIKRNDTESLHFSPLSINFKEFACCKPMKFNRGNIITGRDREIEDILLTLCKKNKRGVVLVGEPGVGKAQPLSSKIRTPSGWTTMGTIEVGSTILCPDGTEATVDGIFPQGEKDVVELIFEDGRTADCCLEHLWKVYSKNWKRLSSESRVIETSLLLDYLGKTSEKLYIDLPSPIEGKEKVPFSPYILGTMLGDGSLTHGPQITNKNPHIHNKWKEEVAENHTVNVKPSRTTFVCSITSNIRTPNLYRNFLRHYELDCKSVDKYIPYEFLESSVENKTKLLQGLIDTDGTVTKTGTLQYSTSSVKLKDDIVYLVRSLGGYAKASGKIPKYKYKDETREGSKSYTITIRIKDPHKYVTLPEKLERIPIDYQYNNLKLKINSFRIKGRKQCCCIYVNHKDHLYITDGFVVTHNTAIVNAISSKLIERTVPRQLIGCQMFNLDVPYIFTKYKEDPFGTIIKVLERASEYDKSILFIDEVHQLLTQKMNDIMKPYLTEKIRFIGSTTTNEFHSIMSDDSALERRFTIVPVLEPSIEQTVGMVTNTKSIFEEHHKCNIPNEVCRYIVENGSRFRGHRKNPDKSLDLLDIACSIMYEKEIEIKRLGVKTSTEYFENLEENNKDIKSAKVVAKDRTLNEYYVNQAISAITGIPYNEIRNSLEYKEVVKNIRKEVVNQDTAIRKIANVVNIFKSVKCDRVRPVSVLLMVGPAGVGKKTVGKLLAKNLFGKEDSFIDYDMSAFGESFRISELKGSPPGYVGYGKSGGLIKKIRNMPQSVVYFRGINKAHQTIQDYILNACRTGKLVDSAEREASLNNAIIIFSVTLSETELKNLKKESSGMGFAKVDKDKPKNLDVEKLLGPNLANSVDEVIEFNELTNEDLKKIFENNKEEVLSTYKIDIDPKELEEQVLSNSKNGHDVISKLSSEVPKLVFKKLSNEEMENEEKSVSEKDRKDD